MQAKDWKEWFAYAEVAMAMSSKDVLCQVETVDWNDFESKHSGKAVLRVNAGEIVNKIKNCFGMM
jgi:hypothetical protein